MSSDKLNDSFVDSDSEQKFSSAEFVSDSNDLVVAQKLHPDQTLNTNRDRARKIFRQFRSLPNVLPNVCKSMPHLDQHRLTGKNLRRFSDEALTNVSREKRRDEIKTRLSAVLTKVMELNTLRKQRRRNSTDVTQPTDSPAESAMLPGDGAMLPRALMKKKLKLTISAVLSTSKFVNPSIPALQRQRSSYKHENIYRGLVRTLLYPLGAPDAAIGLRPGDLLDHLREVFDVEREEHEAFIREELLNKPSILQVNVGLIEANGIKNPDSSDDNLNSFCVLTVHHPAKGRSPRISPKHSPYQSPTASPNVFRRGHHYLSCSADGEEQRTSTIRNSTQPKWNEEFQLDIEELWHDEIHIYLCSQDQAPEDKLQIEKHGGIKSFLGLRKHSSEQEKYHQSGILGKVVIPVRDISCLGTDDWFDIVSYNSYSKHKAVGKCHIRLGISYKQNSDDGLSFSTEDYYQAYLQFLNNTYKISNQKRCVDDQYGLLSIKDHRILKMFAQSHGISKISQAIVSVICLLELYSEDNDIEISESALHHAIDELRMTWAGTHLGQKHLLEKMPLTDAEISHYRRAATRYIQDKCDNMTELPELFPPTSETLNNLKTKLGVTVQLLGIDLWENTCTPQADIGKQLLVKLQDDVNKWISEEIEKLHSAEEDEEIKDTIIPQMERLVDLIEATTSHCSHIGVVKQYFTCLGINYYRVASYAIEKLISGKAMEMMTEMNKYMKRYNSYAVNIMNASKLTLRLYMALRRFHCAVRDNVSRREIFRLPLFHYQEWFEEAMVYWLQTFKTECINRMEKALEIDKDLVVVTALVKYSHSSVDVLSCFASVIDEWRRIDVHDPDCALLGVTKVTDIICDGAILYANKIHGVLERNGYYDSSLNAGFDVNDRLCITLNNIEHVRKYLMELPNLLSWDNIAMMISTRYVTDDVGNQATDMLQRLIDTTNNEILQRSCLLLRQIAEKMRVEMDKYMEIFTKKAPERASSVDQFIGYLNTNIQTLHSQLMPDIYPHMIEQIWNVILKSFHKQLEIGQHPEYYEQIKLHLRAVASFLLRIGLDEKKMESSGYTEMKRRLDLNTKTTTDLMLQYFYSLAKQMNTPTEYYGHLALKAAYMEETRGNVTIYVKVLKGTDLPGLDASGLSDPYVETSLQPHVMFEEAKMQKTSVVKNTLNPTFNTIFQFPNIPKECLKVKGCCILLSVLDHDNIGMDDFAGEVVVHLPSLDKLGLDENIERKPAIIMPLKRPVKPSEGPYEVLSQRDWDRNAKRFILERQRFIDHQPERTDKNKLTRRNPDVGFLSSMFSSILH